jgi:hypothetical protein
MTNRYLRQTQESVQRQHSYHLEYIPLNHDDPTDARISEAVSVSSNRVLVFRELHKASKLKSNTGSCYLSRRQQNASKSIPGRSTKWLKSSGRKASRQKCPTLGSSAVLQQICHLQLDAAVLISAAGTVL